MRQQKTKMIRTSKSRKGGRDRLKIRIPERVFFRIGDVAELLTVKPHVLRYWESEFPVITPEKSASGQRVYRRSDVEMLVLIRHLLHEERYSIEGARKRICELRQEGALREFKQEGVGENSEASGVVLGEPLRDRLTALLCLVRKPLTELFRY